MVGIDSVFGGASFQAMTELGELRETPARGILLGWELIEWPEAARTPEPKEAAQ